MVQPASKLPLVLLIRKRFWLAAAGDAVKGLTRFKPVEDERCGERMQIYLFILNRQSETGDVMATVCRQRLLFALIKLRSLAATPIFSTTLVHSGLAPSITRLSSAWRSLNQAFADIEQQTRKYYALPIKLTTLSFNLNII